MDDPSQSPPSSAADPYTHLQASSAFRNSRSQLMLPIHQAPLHHPPHPHLHLRSEPLVAHPPTSAEVPPPNPQSSHAPRLEPWLSRHLSQSPLSPQLTVPPHPFFFSRLPSPH